jgi:hypothetical protein
MKPILQAFVLAATLALLSGCGSKPEHPAEAFNRIHGGKTVTPHGLIRPDSARQAADGRSVEYETDGGQTWRVPFERRPDGEYAFGAPQDVSQEQGGT